MGFPIKHQAVDIPEIQSLDIREVALHKAKAAYKIIGSPVIVDDTALTFKALGKLPGPFIKWFIDTMSFEDICNMLPESARDALSEVAFCYADGSTTEIFVQEMSADINHIITIIS